MKKKCLLIFTLVTLLCISSVVQVFAVEGNMKSDLIGKEEFAERMTELYKKYDLNFELLDASNYNPFAREIFEAELVEIEKNLVNSINAVNEDNEKLSKLLEEDVLIPINELTTAGDITPYATFIDKELKGSKSIRQAANLFYVTIKYETVAVLNINNGEFVEVEDPGLWYNPLGFNFDGAVYTRQEWYITSMRKQVVASAAGIAKFSYIHPINGGKVTVEEPFTIFDTFNENS